MKSVVFALVLLFVALACAGSWTIQTPNNRYQATLTPIGGGDTDYRAGNGK